MFKYKRTKTVLVFIQVIAILPFLFFIFYLFDMWFDISRSRVLEANLNEGRLLSLYLKENIQYGLNVANTLASFPNLLNIYTEKPEMIKNSFKSIINNNPDINAVYLINREGVVDIFESQMPVPGAEGTSVVDRDYFQEVINSRKTYISDPFSGKINGTNIVVMAVPIMENNDVRSVIVSSINVDRLKEQMEKFYFNGDMKKIYILDSSGNIVISSVDNLDDEFKKSLSNESFIKEARKGNEILLNNRKIPILKETIIGAVVPVVDYNWIIISVQPTSEIFAPLFKLQSVTWLVLLLSLAFSILIISYYIKRIKYVV